MVVLIVGEVDRTAHCNQGLTLAHMTTPLPRGEYHSENPKGGITHYNKR